MLQFDLLGLRLMARRYACRLARRHSRFGGAVLAGCALLPLTANVAAAQSAGRVITESMVDVDHHGTIDTVRVVLRSGELVRDDDEWCGAGLKYVGAFDIVVRLDRGEKTTSLNELILGEASQSELWFRAAPYAAEIPDQPVPWSIQFDDYNGDGQPDFTFGQYAGCNGWDYRLMTIHETGIVARLPFRCECHRILYLNRQENSVGLTSTSHGFEIEYYDNVVGRFRDRYRWLDVSEVFVLEGRERVGDSN